MKYEILVASLFSSKIKRNATGEIERSFHTKNKRDIIPVMDEYRGNHPFLNTLLPVLADALVVVGVLLTIQRFGGALAIPSGRNALILAIFYSLFCIGVYLIRKLVPAVENGRWSPPEALLQRNVMALFGVLFGLLMVTSLSYQLGYFSAIQEIRAGLIGEGATSAFFVFGPGSWIGFSMLAIFIIAFPINANVQPESGKYLWVSFLGLLLSNSMLLFVAAQSRAILDQLGIQLSAVVFLILLAALIISFLPARAHYLSKQPALSSLISFIVSILLVVVIILWRSF